MFSRKGGSWGRKHCKLITFKSIGGFAKAFWVEQYENCQLTKADAEDVMALKNIKLPSVFVG